VDRALDGARHDFEAFGEPTPQEGLKSVRVVACHREAPLARVIESMPFDARTLQDGAGALLRTAAVRHLLEERTNRSKLAVDASFGTASLQRTFRRRGQIDSSRSECTGSSGARRIGLSEGTWREKGLGRPCIPRSAGAAVTSTKVLPSQPWPPFDTCRVDSMSRVGAERGPHGREGLFDVASSNVSNCI